MTPRWLRRRGRKAPAPGPPASPAVRVVPSPAPGTDVRDIAMAIAREALAPPPLGELAGDVMLAVASVPGKLPEEWRAAGFLWMAWPHAAEAWVHAMEMTAAQLRDRLARLDSHG